MGSTALEVGAITTYLTGTAANGSYNYSARNDKKNVQNGFDSILNQVSSGKSDISKQDAARKNLVDTGRSQNVSKSSDSDNAAKKADEAGGARGRAVNRKPAPEEKGISKDKNQLEESDKNIDDALAKTGFEIAEKCSEVLEVSMEEIVRAMENLGLSFADLLNTENINLLAANVGGQEQAINLITDSDIYTSLQDLIEGAEGMKTELMNELGLSEEDLSKAIEDYNFRQVMEQGTKDNPGEITQKADESLIKPHIKPVADENKNAPQSEGFDENQISTEKTVTVENIQKSSDKNTGNQNFGTGSESANLFNQIVNNIAEAVTEETAAPSYTEKAQMEDIIRQITDKITISASKEETSMELQLHPASLGNVNILLTSSKEGIVAKFTAQNEIVKEAVESQMLQLQQKFNEQGIKITSIEVTIASHAFEQNLQQNEHNEQTTDDRPHRRGLRRINLVDALDEDEEDMTEADKLAASVMAMNGNSVDFSA